MFCLNLMRLLTLKLSLQEIGKILFVLIIVAFGAMRLHAMDWETATEIASSPNRPGYEKDAERLTALIKNNEIHVIVVYFIRRQGIRAITEDHKAADEFGAFVNRENADRARELLQNAIQSGLEVSLVFHTDTSKRK